MRDILITVIVLGLLPFILRSPRIGAYVWAWLSLMNPHRARIWICSYLPFAHLVALSTLVSFLFSRDRRPFPVNSITVTQVLLLVWMSITCFFALNTTEIVLGALDICFQNPVDVICDPDVDPWSRTDRTIDLGRYAIGWILWRQRGYLDSHGGR